MQPSLTKSVLYRWCLGIILHEMVVGHGPFDTKLQRRSPKIVHAEILATAVTPVPCSHKIFKVEPGLRELVQGLLTYEPSQRLGTMEVGGVMALQQATRWLQTVNWDRIKSGEATASFVPPQATSQKDGGVDTSLFDSAQEAAQEYREQEAFACWLPALQPSDAKLFENLCD